MSYSSSVLAHRTKGRAHSSCLVPTGEHTLRLERPGQAAGALRQDGPRHMQQVAELPSTSAHVDRALLAAVQPPSEHNKSIQATEHMKGPVSKTPRTKFGGTMSWRSPPTRMPRIPKSMPGSVLPGELGGWPTSNPSGLPPVTPIPTRLVMKVTPRNFTS